jgi:hypothetical protein
MRARLRTSTAGRTRALPAQSRVTVRRTGANLVRTTQLAAALRESREALVNIQGQLDALLAAVRDPGAALDAGAPERLHGATRRAGSLVATLGALSRQR